MFKILWRKVLIGLLAEETFHQKGGKRITIYDLLKQGFYHIEDISLMFLVLRKDLLCPKACLFFLTVYNTGYCLSTKLCFAYSLYDYTMATLFLRKVTTFLEERAGITLET